MITPRYSSEEACDLAEHEILAFADAVALADPQQPVPTCPGWSVARVARHTGDVHRWAAAHVERLAPDRIDPSTLDFGRPADDAGLAGWLRAGASPVVATLRHADPDAAVWAWGADKHVRFWPRRLLHETTVHRADIELARGLAPEIEPAIAADGVDELLDNLPHAAYFAPNVGELRGDGETIHLHATDLETGEWVIRLGPQGYDVVHGHEKATAALRAPAADLLLILYGRLPVAAGEVFGDGDLLKRFITNAAL